MSTSAATNSGEPPRNTNQPPSPTPLTNSPLPDAIVEEIIALVPRRYHPILSCVSKNFRNFLRSPMIHKIRSLLGLDSLYICFVDKSSTSITPNWFTLRRIENQNRFTSINIPFPPHPSKYLIIAIGPEMFFFGWNRLHPSTFMIFDSRSRTFRDGPSIGTKEYYRGIGRVGEKIYVIGDTDLVFHAEAFDLKNQVWEIAPVPETNWFGHWNSIANVVVDKKVYGFLEIMRCYDTRDGSCETFELPCDKWWKTGVCAIENVVYVYYHRSGLMWFDTEVKLWREVEGLSDLKEVRFVGMGEYYGKMAFLWKEYGVVKGETKEIWCRMIVLDKSGVGIRGIAEPGQCLGVVPRSYRPRHCLSVSD